MRNKLMVTVAVAALIGGASIAVAQQQEEKGAAPKAGTTEQHAAPGGAMQHPQGPAGTMQRQPMAPGGAAQNQATPDKGNTMQRGAEENGNPGVKAQEHAQTSPNGKSNENAQTQERGNANQNAATTKTSGAKSVQMSETQRTQIKGIIGKDRNVARVNSANFSVAVGVAVPRSVHVEVLPADIVTIVPQYEGFEYIVVGDELLIIDPNTLEIVAILPV
jgi:hypothetical protein